MPRKAKVRGRGAVSKSNVIIRRRPFAPMNGKGKAWDWIKGAAGTVNKFLKKTKIASTLGNALGSLPIPGANYLGKAGAIAGTLGYGKPMGMVGRCSNKMDGRGRKVLQF